MTPQVYIFDGLSDEGPTQVRANSRMAGLGCRRHLPPLEELEKAGSEQDDRFIEALKRETARGPTLCFVHASAVVVGNLDLLNEHAEKYLVVVLYSGKGLGKNAASEVTHVAGVHVITPPVESVSRQDVRALINLFESEGDALANSETAVREAFLHKFTELMTRVNHPFKPLLVALHIMLSLAAAGDKEIPQPSQRNRRQAPHESVVQHLRVARNWEAFLGGSLAEVLDELKAQQLTDLPTSVAAFESLLVADERASLDKRNALWNKIDSLLNGARSAGSS